MSTITISIVQSNLHWENKAANLRMFGEKIRSISEYTEIVVLPEMFSTGFSMNPHSLAESMEGDTVAWMKNLAAERKIILTGSVIIKDQVRNENGETADGYFNRLIWMLPNGHYGFYDKRHRFAFAGEDLHYQAGSKRLIASAKGWKINLLVCYDLRFPVWARQQGAFGEAEYDIMIYVANWPERRIHAWKTLLQARAIENQCYVVGVNRTGHDGNDIHYSGESMIIDPMGEIMYTEKDREDIFTITLDRNLLDDTRKKLPFLKDADRFRILNDE